MSSIGYDATSLLLKEPAHLKSILSKREQQLWSEQDFDDMRELILKMSAVCAKAKGEEARLGSSPNWQAVCDKFAAEYNMLVIAKEEDGDVVPAKGLPKLGASSTSSNKTSVYPIPIRIHATPNDNLAKLESIKWIADRCYGGATEVVYLERKAASHAIMTMLGGPPSNPTLLHKIARNWGLFTDEVATTRTRRGR
mmetsp:Transcript_2614/g.3561  ORF Transcript_2614/g.3561 Transcript_2614/m.3561 type:complete len:196 (-) Transcript_2614:167-754(-)